MYQKTTLDNGLRVLTSHMPHTASVCISIFIGTGSRYEIDQQAGISHYIEHMLFRGTSKRKTAREISEAIEGVGGILNGGTDKELTVYWCKVGLPYFPLAVEVLTDMLRNSRFDTEDMEKERQIIIEEIHMSNDSPSQRVDMLIDELIWPEHPLGRDVAGSIDTVAGITREMILDYFQEQYLPVNTVISVAGNISHDETVALINGTLGDWKNSRPCSQYLPYHDKTCSRLRIENRDTEQAHICLALPGISILNPQRFNLDLLNVVLGEGMSSRLFTQVRDKLGLAYSIHSYVEHLLDTGSVAVTASMEPKNLPIAIQAVLEQLCLLREAVPEPELKKAKEMSKGRLLLRMEDSRSVSGWMGGQELLTGQILSPEEVLSIIDGVTALSIQDIAREIFKEERLRLAVVGPVTTDEKLEELLKL